jgi:hypothetical protein
MSRPATISSVVRTNSTSTPSLAASVLNSVTTVSGMTIRPIACRRACCQHQAHRLELDHRLAEPEIGEQRAPAALDQPFDQHRLMAVEQRVDVADRTAARARAPAPPWRARSRDNRAARPRPR